MDQHASVLRHDSPCGTQSRNFFKRGEKRKNEGLLPGDGKQSEINSCRTFAPFPVLLFTLQSMSTLTSHPDFKSLEESLKGSIHLPGDETSVVSLKVLFVGPST